MGAGQKRELVSFEKRAVGPTEGGGTVGPWQEQFQTSARVRYLRGGENVIGQRMKGVSPIIFTVHDFTKTQLVTNRWRIRDVRTGDTYNIRSITPGERAFDLDILCEIGVPDG